MAIVAVCDVPLNLSANKFADVCPSGWLPVTYSPPTVQEFTVSDIDPVTLGEWFTLGFVIFLIPFLTAKMCKLLLDAILKF